jgi:uracil-DNA glycosylase
VNSVDTLKQIADEVRVCQNCGLYHTRKLSVPGEGPADAAIMFIGEGPGFNENEQGRPFVGAAGKFLEELLAKAGLRRKDVFICNVVKCRPPNNRDPEPTEIIACGKYLDRQIEAINPKVIVTLGRFSMAKFFPNARISLIHGKASRVNDRLVVAMYHPAAALHQPTLRPDLEKDFAGLAYLLHPETVSTQVPVPTPVVQQTPKPVEPKPVSPSAQIGFLHELKPADSPDSDSDKPEQLSLF